MTNSIYDNLKENLLRIKSYSSFNTFFDNEFNAGNSLRGIKWKIFRRLAEDYYNLAQLDIVVTSIKYSDLKDLIDTCSVSYMGKYGTFNKVKVNI